MKKVICFALVLIAVTCRLAVVDGHKAYSNLFTIANSMATPTQLAAVSYPNDSTKATLHWIDNSDNEDGFQIERKVGAGDWTKLVRTSANATLFVGTGVVANAANVYRAKAFKGTEGAEEYSAYSNEATIDRLIKIEVKRISYQRDEYFDPRTRIGDRTWGFYELLCG